MRRLHAAALWAFAVLGVACDRGCNGHDAPREVATLTLGDVSIRLQATLTCHHFSAGFSPNMDWRAAHDVCGISVVPAATRGGAGLAVAPDGAVFGAEIVTDTSRARDALAALTVDACADTTRAVWRVHDPLASAPGGWQIAFPMKTHIVHALLDHPANDCPSALAAAPAPDDWLMDAVTAWDVCSALDDEGRAREALRCILQTGLTRSSAPFEALGGKYETANAHGDLDVDLRAILAPDPRADARSWSDFTARDYLNASPDREMKRALVDETMTYCAKRTLAPRCPEWRTRAIWFVAGELGDPSLCERGLSIADEDLGRASRDGAVSALRVIPQLCGCGAESPHLARIMRAGLTRPTVDDVVLPSDDFRVYESVDDECQDSAISHGSAGGRCDILCRSLPRLAGSWLGRHCDADTVKAAKEALSARPSRDPRTDMIVDGALRVLGRCSPADFERELLRVPPGAHPDRVKALLEP